MPLIGTNRDQKRGLPAKLQIGLGGGWFFLFERTGNRPLILSATSELKISSPSRASPATMRSMAATFVLIQAALFNSDGSVFGMPLVVIAFLIFFLDRTPCGSVCA